MTLVAQVFNFLILVLLLKKFAYGPLMRVLEERQSKIEGSIQAAEAQRAEAEALKEEYRAQIAAARSEAQAIVERAVRAAEESRAAILADAKKEQARILAAAREQVELERRRAMSELKKEVVTLSVAAAAKVIAENLDEEKNAALVGRFIEQLDGKESGGLPC